MKLRNGLRVNFESQIEVSVSHSHPNEQMGVDKCALIRYGVVLKSRDFWKQVYEFVPDLQEECVEDACHALFGTQLKGADSVDAYTGEDTRSEIYLFLAHKGAQIGEKCAVCAFYDKDRFVVTEEEDAFLQRELTRVGFAAPRAQWIFRTYLE
jgi:hypothetical protein